MMSHLDIRDTKNDELPTVPLEPAAEGATSESIKLPGIREAVVRTPFGDICQVEVTSWTQVPYVLHKLQASPVKAVFPVSSDPTVMVEQSAIKEFLRTNHSRSIEDLLAGVALHLDSSPSFIAAEQPPVGTFANATSWIEAQILPAISLKRLTVTDVIKAPATAAIESTDFYTACISAFTSGRPVIVMPAPDADIELVALVLDDVLTKIPGGHTAAQKISVWLADRRTPDTWNYELPLSGLLTSCGLSLLRGQLCDELQAIELRSLSPAPGDTMRGVEALPVPSADESVIVDARRSVSSVDDEQSMEDFFKALGLEELLPPPIEAYIPVEETEEVQAADTQASAPSCQLIEEDESTPVDTVSESSFRKLAMQHLMAVSRTLPRDIEALKRIDILKSEYLERFYTHRMLPDVRWPVNDQTSVRRFDNGSFQAVSIVPGKAAAILEECRARSFEDSARLLFEAHEHLLTKYHESERSNTSVQTNFLVTLPDKGTAIFVSDLEGDVAKLALLIDQYELIQRWERGEPVFLCVLGDIVDRSVTGSLLVEFLLDLKVRRGFSRQVIIVPGNHELSNDQNFDDLKFYNDNNAPLIGDLFGRDYPSDGADTQGSEILTRLHQLCPSSVLVEAESSREIEPEIYKARWGLYTLIKGVFQALPRSIVSKNGIFAAHAGIPMSGPMAELFQPDLPQEIDTEYYRSAIAARIFEGTNLSTSLKELTWSDLDPELAKDGACIPLSDPRRKDSGGRDLFSPSDFKRFCRGTDTSLMIRGHQSRAPRDSVCPAVVEEVVDAYHKKPWMTGNIVTVAPQAEWSALIDLSIQQPNADQVSWIGLFGRGIQPSARRHSNGRFRSTAPWQDFFMVLPPLGGK